MKWVEVSALRLDETLLSTELQQELMTCYYGESQIFDGVHKDWMDSDDRFRSKTQVLLDNEVWRGQQRGPSINDPVHTRSMRPRCELVSNGTQLFESGVCLGHSRSMSEWT